jgi:hypothetical protein
MLIECTVDELKLVDGGDIQMAGAASGPMWEIDHDWDGITPIGISADYLGWKTYGKGTAQIDADMLPMHQHEVLTTGLRTLTIDGDTGLESAPMLPQWFMGNNVAAGNPDTAAPVELDKTTDLTVGTETGVNENMMGGVNLTFEIVHPVRGVWMCRRTNRIYYKVTE